MSIFSEFFRSFLLWSKKDFFLSGISKNVCLWLFLLKKTNISEKGRFFDKSHGVTLLENVDFFRLCENFTFEVQKALFSIQNIKECFFLAFLARKKHLKKRSIFWENHGLTPLQNVDFCDFFRSSPFRSKKYSFLSRISKNPSFWLFWLKKKHKKKRSIFWQKPWTNPFLKEGFFRLFENFTFKVQRTFFSIQNIKKCFFMAFC